MCMINNKKISELVSKYGSDKNLSGYTYDIYEPILENIIKENIKSVLEIGIGTLQPGVSSFCGNVNLKGCEHYKPGGSLRAWRDYFENAQIYGIDVAADCIFEEERIKTYICDSTSEQTCNDVLTNLEFDIIIDDGLHTGLGQLLTLKNNFKRLKDNGYYFIEDSGGGGDGTNIQDTYGVEFRKIVDEHEYFNRGNILVIRKTYSKRGLLPSIESFKSDVFRENLDLTVVTGLWNINRTGRSFDHYIDNLNKLLDIDVNLFLYLPKDLEQLVWKKRSRRNTFVKIYELDDIKNLYKPFWDKTQNIRTDPNWFNKAGWLTSSPQASLEWYNPIVQSKMFLLNDVTIWNPFDTKHFIWLDAGITNTVYEKYFTDNKCLNKIIPYLNDFLFLSYPYEADTEIHGFNFNRINQYSGQKVKYVCRGGLFGGSKDQINQANATYYSLLDKTLNDGYMGTEESIFTIMSYLEPEKYRRYSLDSNGLIVKFVQALIDNKVELEVVPKTDNNICITKKSVNPDKLKVSIYMLTFNFPHQVEHTINTWLKHPKWITNTRNILIDNSTNEEARIANAELCKKYNFEHIINNKNTGINGGRFKAAQHFQESDSDYYVFLEDDMGIHEPGSEVCRNGFRTYIPNLYDKVLKIIDGDNDVDFLKFSYTEVYMDNNIQVSWYNVPQTVRNEIWPTYSKLPVTGHDPNCPRTKFDTIEVVDGLSYIKGEVYYANWPMIVGKRGNKKMFLDTTWAHPYEQTWMSHMFQETRKGNLKPAVLLASPVNHNRIAYYKPEERKENAG